MKSCILAFICVGSAVIRAKTVPSRKHAAEQSSVVTEQKHSGRMYQFFDEYLLHSNTEGNKEIALIARLALPPEKGKPKSHKLRHFHQKGHPHMSGVKRRRKRPSEKVACCLLGKVAGEQGYHCQASFYKERIQLRNKNRAQTRKEALDDISREPAYNLELWNTFSQCVENNSKPFHSCCYAERILDFNLLRKISRFHRKFN